MANRASRPVTVRQRVAIPRDAILYRTSLRVAAEKDLPAIGDSMDAFLGSSFSNSLVLSVSDAPRSRRDDDHTHSILHGPVPASHTEYEPIGYTFPPIYPEVYTPPAVPTRTFYPGGSRARSRVVMAKVDYDYSITPATWSGDAAYGNDLTTGPLEVDSALAGTMAVPYIDDNGEWRRIGEWLNSYFVAENTLNDQITISDPGTLAYTINASAPSASDYETWVTNKSYFIASRFVTRWRGPIYMRVTQRVRAQ